MSSPGHEWTPHEREGWSVCSRCGMVRNYDRETTTCSGALPKIRQRSEVEDCGQSRASCPKTDHVSEGDDETDIIIAGRQVPTFIEAAASAGSLGIRHDSWAPGLIVRWRTYGWEQYTPARGWELLLYPSLALGPRGILSLPILIAQGWSVEPEAKR